MCLAWWIKTFMIIKYSFLIVFILSLFRDICNLPLYYCWHGTFFSIFLHYLFIPLNLKFLSLKAYSWVMSFIPSINLYLSIGTFNSFIFNVITDQVRFTRCALFDSLVPCVFLSLYPRSLSCVNRHSLVCHFNFLAVSFTTYFLFLTLRWLQCTF